MSNRQLKFNWSKILAQSLSCVWLFASPWTAAHQAPLSFTISRSLVMFMSSESVIPSNHLVLYHPFSSCLQSFPEPGSFLMSQLFTSGGHSIGASASDLKLSSSYFPPQQMATPFFQLLEPKTVESSFSLDKDGSIMKSCWFYLQNIARNWLLQCWSTPQSSCAKIISIFFYLFSLLMPLSLSFYSQHSCQSNLFNA